MDYLPQGLELLIPVLILVSYSLQRWKHGLTTTWRDVAETYKERADQLAAQVDALTAEVKALRAENAELREMLQAETN